MKLVHNFLFNDKLYSTLYGDICLSLIHSVTSKPTESPGCVKQNRDYEKTTKYNNANL